MNNFQKSGETLTLTAPAGGVISGNGYLIGAMFVVATATVAATLPFEGLTEGVFTLPKVAGEGALVEGKPVYWDVANTRISIDPTVGLPIGLVAIAALDADVTCAVSLDGDSLAGRALTVRKRIPIAAINAAGGATLIPAVPGIKIRVVDEYAIAIGGAVTATTTVDLLGTQAAASVKLVSHAVAGLTRSAVLRAGDANSAVLADGASFAQNDVGTAVVVSKTGAALLTATSVDVAVTYTLE